MSRSRETDATGVGHRNAALATLTGILDRFSRKDRIPALHEDERLDGKRCLVTGASSGLGKAIATELARRGAHVVLACRSGIPEAGEDIARASGSDRIEMIHVDLADLRSVHALADSLAKSGRPLDRVVLNAGLMAKQARRSAQGFEIMFAVHFLANRLLVERLLVDGVISPTAADSEADAPRIIFITSESHRSADPIDWDHFGEFVDYGLTDGMKQYASSKLHMCTFAWELARRLDAESGEAGKSAGRRAVAVHAVCPGPVNSNIAREAPTWLAPVLRAVFGVFFQSPERACEPAVFLTCARSIEHRQNVYLHMMREKTPSPSAVDPGEGARLFVASDQLLAEHGRP